MVTFYLAILMFVLRYQVTKIRNVTAVYLLHVEHRLRHPSPKNNFSLYRELLICLKCFLHPYEVLSSVENDLNICFRFAQSKVTLNFLCVTIQAELLAHHQHCRTALTQIVTPRPEPSARSPLLSQPAVKGK